MKKNQTIFKIRVNKDSILENTNFFKDYLISSNILNSDFSNIKIFFFEKDNLIEDILKENIFPNSIFFQITKENFKNIIKLHNKDFSKTETQISLIILPQKNTENGPLIEPYEKKFIHKIKSHLKFVITNVPENNFVKKLPSWTKNVMEGKFTYRK
jgi:hypothetical protein